MSPVRDGAKRTARGRYAWRDDKTSLKRMPIYSEHVDGEMLLSDQRPAASCDPVFPIPARDK